MTVIWRMRNALACLIMTALISGWGTVVVAPDCNQCPSIANDLEVLSKDARSAEAELIKQKEAVKNIPTDQDSKKMMMTAHLLVLAANAETAQNLYLRKQNDSYFNQCSSCGKKSKGIK